MGGGQPGFVVTRCAGYRRCGSSCTNEPHKQVEVSWEVLWDEQKAEVLSSRT